MICMVAHTPDNIGMVTSQILQKRSFNQCFALDYNQLGKKTKAKSHVMGYQSSVGQINKVDWEED